MHATAGHQPWPSTATSPHAVHGYPGDISQDEGRQGSSKQTQHGAAAAADRVPPVQQMMSYDSVIAAYAATADQPDGVSLAPAGDADGSKVPNHSLLNEF